MIAKAITNSVDFNNLKECEPVYKITYYNTNFSCKSSGIQLQRYLMSNTAIPDFSGLTNLTLVDTLRVPIVGFYAEDGSMLGMTKTDDFALHYHGHFYTTHLNQTQEYYFKAYGFGYLRVDVNNKYEIGTQDSYEVLDPFKPLISKGTKLTADTWYSIDIYYYSLQEESGFTLLWKNRGNNDIYIPVSAGVVTQESAYLTGYELAGVLNVERSEPENEIHTLKFTLPLVPEDSSDTGYFYDPRDRKYIYTTGGVASSTVILSKFKMIEFEAGYKIGGTNNYIKKFIGHIESFNIIREPGGNKLEVNCVGFENFYKQSLNMNYPNLYDYWNAEYAGNITSEYNPDGIGCPCTFDGWELYKVFRALSIRAGIDPYLFLTKKQFLNSSSTVVNGNRLIEEAAPTKILLDTNINYGNSQVVNTDISSIPDDEYIMKSNFGDTIFDYFNTIVDVYGWKWGCNSYYSGAPYLKSNNNAYTYITAFNNYCSSEDWTVFTEEKDIDTICGRYVQTNYADAFVTFMFTGQKADLITVCDNDSGYETYVTAYSTDLTQLTVNSSTNFLPNQVIIVETIAGEETATITGVAGNVLDLVSALTNKPYTNGYIRTATFKAELKRGKTWTTGTTVQTTYHSCHFDNSVDKYIKTVSYQTNLSNMTIGTKRFYYEGIDPTTNVNPCKINIANGLSYDTYLLRITRLTNTQIGPTHYLRVNALYVYDNDTNKIVKTFYTGDSVVSGTVLSMNVEDSGVDVRNDTIVVGRRLGVETPTGDDDRPINPNNPSYQFIVSRATDTASIFNPDARNYVGYHRQTIQIAPEIASVDRCNYWAVAFINRYREPRKFPEFECLGHPLIEKGDCVALKDEGYGLLNTYDRFWITGIEETYEKKKYLSRFTTISYEPWESYAPRAPLNVKHFGGMPIQNFDIENGGTSLTETDYYDPYLFDYNGKRIKIKYDLIKSGYVRIDIYNYELPNILVATLLNPTGSEGKDGGWQKQEVGKNYIVTWDGVDMYGEWNKYCTENNNGLDGYDNVIGKGYFAKAGRLIHTDAGRNPTQAGQFFVKMTFVNKTATTPVVYYSNIENEGIPGKDFIYTRTAALSTINEPFFRLGKKCVFKDNESYPLSLITPQVCYSDSIHDKDGNDMCNSVIFKDTNLDAILYKRKLQLQIIGHNLVVIVGCKQTLITYPDVYVNNYGHQIVPIKEDIYYDNKQFIDYTSNKNFLEKYLNFNNMGYHYSYSNYVNKEFLDRYPTFIYMSWHVYVECIATDKDGKIFRTGKWLLWIDDKEPLPNIRKPEGSNDGWGYDYHLVYYKPSYLKDDGNKDYCALTITDSTGTNVIDDLGEFNMLSIISPHKIGAINTIKVYPKTDNVGNNWGPEYNV